MWSSCLSLWLDFNSITNKAPRAFSFLKSKWLRYFVVQRDGHHDSGNRAINIFCTLKSEVLNKTSYFINTFSLTWKCVCFLAVKILVWIFKEKSHGLESGLGQQMQRDSNPSSRTDQPMWLWASDIISPSLGFFISERGILATACMVVWIPLSRAPGAWPAGSIRLCFASS